MAEILFEGNGIISLGSVESEEDVNPRPGININPPPRDGRCVCCGRQISELEPFPPPDDDFLLLFHVEGTKLLKLFRPGGPYDEEAEKAVAEAPGDERDLEFLIDKYGEDKGKGLFYTSMAYHTVLSSWECWDCIGLDTNEYWAKRDKIR